MRLEVLSALKRNGAALRFATEGYRADPLLVLAAIEKKPEAWR